MDVTNRYVLDFARRFPGAAILDFGCGAGELVEAARAAGMDMRGCDIYYAGSDARAQAGQRGLLGTCVIESRAGSIPFADADGDHDVDQVDFGAYQSCFAGPGNDDVAYECRCFDRDKDGDIDLADFAEFAKCVTGPAIHWAQALTPDCAP